MEKVKKFFKTYDKTIILLGAVILGGVIGAIWGEGASVLKPFGTLFLNLIQVIVVPLVFLSVATAIGNIRSAKRIGKLFLAIIIVLILMSLVSSLIAYFATRVDVISPSDSQSIIAMFGDGENIETNSKNLLESTVEMISVDDFSKLLSTDNLIALLVMSILTGIALQKSGEKGKKLLDVLESANEVVNKIVELIMYYAPIGLACYFATIIGNTGAEITKGYIKSMAYFTATALFMYFIVYSLYAFIAGGMNGFKSYWANVLLPTATAMGTCSSAASIPVAIKYTERMGIEKEVANTAIPLGVAFHKEGCIVSYAFMTAFACELFNKDVSLISFVGIALIAAIIASSVPMGGGVYTSVFIMSALGCPLAAYPIISIMGNILDMPMTVLNLTGNISAAMLVNKFLGTEDLEQK